jgi:hypothetical protein
MSSYHKRASEIESDPTSSFWIIKAIRELGDRDPLDALIDCECLADLMRKRNDELCAVERATHDVK